MRYFKILVLLFILVNASGTYAQDNIQLGGDLRNMRQTQSGLFDYSDPGGINIKVQLWGYVKFPGYYIVPLRTTINELISLAGGPQEDALLSDVRVLKLNDDSTTIMNRYNYNDFMWEKELKEAFIPVQLEAGDIVVVPGEPRYFIRQDISFYLSVVTALASLAALIISITK